MKHVTAYIFAAILSISLTATAFAADTYRNATVTFNSSYAVNYSMGGIQIGATSGTVISDPFLIQNSDGSVSSTSATSSTVISDPFSIQNPQSNSTDMQGLLSYMSTQPFLVQTSGMSISYNVMESTNNALVSISNYCSATSAAVELVDASNGNVLTTLDPLPSFCGISWLLGLSSSYTYNIPANYVGKNVYVRLHVTETAQYSYTSFPSSSLTNLGYSPFSGLLGGLLKQAGTDGVVAGNAQLLGNYPNPVANTTTISMQNTVGGVSLKVYNMLGQMVADLSNQVPQTSGVANVMFDASQLQNGVYFYRLQAADGTASQRELIVKK